MGNREDQRAAGGHGAAAGGRRWLRRGLLALGGLLAFVLLLIGGALAFLSTDAGRDTLAGVVEDSASGPDSTLSIGALEGSLLDRFVLRDVVMSDGGGAWLRIDRAALDWSPSALIGGTLRIEQLAATRIEVLRAPAGGAEEKAEDSAAPGSLDPLPVELVLRDLKVEELVLGEALAGAEARLGIEGQLSASRPDGIATRLLVQRTDGMPGRISLDALYRPEAETLRLSLKAEEPAGGLIAGLAGMPDLPAVSLSLEGEGPIATWKGRLAAEAGEAGSLDSEAQLSSLEPLQARIEGRLQPGSLLLPPDIEPLVAPATDFAVALSLAGGEDLEISDLTLSAPAGRVTGSGSLDLAGGGLSANFQVAPQTAKLAKAFGLPLSARALTVALTAGGTLDRPEATVTLSGEALTYQDASLDSLDGEIALASTGAGWQIDGSGRFDGLTAAELEGAESATRNIDWSLHAETGPNFQQLSGVELALYGGGVELSAEGGLDLAALTGDGALTLKIAELAPFSGLAGAPLQGSVEAEALISSTGDGGATATLGATLENFDASGLGLPMALGESIDLYAEAESGSGQAVTLHSLELGGEGFSLTAKGNADPAAGSLDGSYRLEARDLSRFSALAGTELAGSGSVEGTVAGSLEAPEVTAKLQARELAVAGQSFPSVTVDASADELAAAPAGRADFQARTPYGEVSGRLVAALEGETLKISELSLKTPKGEALNAQASLPLSGGPAQGTLTGSFPSLALVSNLTGVPVQGSGELRIELGAAEGRQTASITGNFEDIVVNQEGGEALSVQAADLRATAREDGGDYSVDATLNLARLRGPDAALETAQLTAQGALSALSVTAEGRGEMTARKEALSFSTAAELDLSGAPSGQIARLEAAIGERRAELNAPVSFDTAQGGFSLSGLDLSVGEGRLTGSAELAGNKVDGGLELAGLPLEFLRPFLPGPDVTGRLDGRLTLQGSAKAPEGSFQVSLSEFRVERRFSSELQPLALDLDGRIGGGKLTAEGRLTGLSGGEGARLNADLPFDFSLSPFAAGIRENDPISAALQWQGEVAPLIARLPVDDHRLEGDADIDLRLAGSLAAPELRGGVVLSDATYENFVSGTLLEDLQVELAAEGDRLAIRNLSANDGSGGQDITGSGAFAVNPQADSEVSASLQFDEATVIRRDDLEATISGDFAVEGDLSRLVLTGDLTGDKVEVRLIDDLPPSVTELQVTEINSDDPAPPEPEKEEEKVSTPMEIVLDLQVDLPRRVFIRGQGLDSEWEGEFDISGTAQNPSVKGQLRPVRGNFSFAGKTFELQDGSVTLPGGSDLNPQLDLSAVYTASNIEARVRVFGSASDPQFELSSTPPLPQEEIVSRILFERGTAQLTAAEAFQLSSTVASLTGAGGPGILDTARQTLGLDVLSFGAGEEGSLGEVKAGKYIADDIFVGVRQGATPQSTSAVVEVEVTDNITIKSENKATGDTSVGVTWEWEY